MRNFIDALRLNEAYAYATDHVAIVKYVLDNMDDDEATMEDFANDNDLEPEEVDTDSSEFKSWFSSHVEDNYADALWAIQSRFKGGLLPLYRAITAPVDWTPDDARHPGIYWTWDRDAADAHWGDFNSGHVKWLLETKVTDDQIDWLVTLGQNAMHSYSDEKEVRLKEGTPVKLTNYSRMPDRRGW